ncbi:MAG: cytochrome C552 [Nitrospirae bacterium]|nr:cytochrome C552 [Nitrospirota bacterium]
MVDLLFRLAVIFILVIACHSSAAASSQPPSVSEEGRACLDCHETMNPGLVSQWGNSPHAASGIDCYSCHQANEGDPAVFDHYGKKIAVIVTPRYCAPCHEAEVAQFEASHHAKGAQFIGSLDNFLGEIIEGGPAAIKGCRQCHGSEVRYLGDGKFDPATWPNSGIGRVNPDGSRGTCAACHGRHGFTSAQARQPENCGKCHMGPDHPQIEIYRESKHGVQFEAHKGEMNLESKSWIVGKDYSAAPTCATCHMSATSNQPTTHDAGARISYTLRPVISKKLDNWEKRRDNMKDVCRACHQDSWVNNFYVQYESAVELYNEKFARPAQEIMDQLKVGKKITPAPFDDKIEWTFYELWHHEGRRARMGASMMGPDFTQWHGFYEVAKHFYNEFLPEAEALSPGITKKFLDRDEHRWKQGLGKDEVEKMLDFYRKRYGQ